LGDSIAVFPDPFLDEDDVTRFPFQFVHEVPQEIFFAAPFRTGYQEKPFPLVHDSVDLVLHEQSPFEKPVVAFREKPLPVKFQVELVSPHGLLGRYVERKPPFPPQNV